jgi:hypothetical protein
MMREILDHPELMVPAVPPVRELPLLVAGQLVKELNAVEDPTDTPSTSLEKSMLSNSF